MTAKMPGYTAEASLRTLIPQWTYDLQRCYCSGGFLGRDCQSLWNSRCCRRNWLGQVANWACDLGGSCWCSMISIA